MGLQVLSLQKPPVSLRVQVPNNHILTQNLYYNCSYPKPKYPNPKAYIPLCIPIHPPLKGPNYWVLGPSGYEVSRKVSGVQSLDCQAKKLKPSPSRNHMGGCQNYGPFLDTRNIRCRIIIGIQKGTIILTITHIGIRGSFPKRGRPQYRPKNTPKKMWSSLLGPPKRYT